MQIKDIILCQSLTDNKVYLLQQGLFYHAYNEGADFLSPVTGYMVRDMGEYRQLGFPLYALDKVIGEIMKAYPDAMIEIDESVVVITNQLNTSAMKKFLSWMTLHFGKDRIIHFCVSLVLALALTVSVYHLGVEWERATSFATLLTFLIGIVKECYDKWWAKGIFDPKDVLADIFGITLALIILLMV